MDVRLKGQYFRIIDLEGNQAVDTLFMSAENPTERYSAMDTLAINQQIYLEKGTKLYSNLGRPIAVIHDDNCGRHDTIGGACSCESNTVRYAHETYQCIVAVTTLCMPWQNTRLQKHGLNVRHIGPNINFYECACYTRRSA